MSGTPRDPAGGAEPGGGAEPRRDTSWDPVQYQRFSDHRLRPALELLARIPVEAPRTVVDLGCGTGNVTRVLAQWWPGAEVSGVDHSLKMLAEARTGSSPEEAEASAPVAGAVAQEPQEPESSEPETIRWIEADIAAWTPDTPPDVIYANASLHWLPEHRELLPRLAGALADGGCLAVQMPLSWSAPSHRIMREILDAGGPGESPLGTEALRQSLARRPVADANVYYDLLAAPGRAMDIWETEYVQVLDGEDPVMEWVKGTGLRPVLDGLTGDERKTFLAAYRRRLSETYPRRPDGTTLYPFRRLFIVVRVPLPTAARAARDGIPHTT